MDLQANFCREHVALRKHLADLRALREKSETSPESLLQQFKTLLTDHFKKEEVEYRILDQEKQLIDRAIVHQLRNDHAALTFGMESLLIRLRKNGPTTDWWNYFEKLMQVFEPHLDLEEKQIFPLWSAHP